MSWFLSWKASKHAFFLLLLQTLSQSHSYGSQRFFFKCNLNITNVEFNVSTSLLPTPKNRRISLSPRLVILSWATRFEMHTSPSSSSLTAPRTVVTKTDFFSSPSPTIQNIVFPPNEKEKWQHGGKTMPAFPWRAWISTRYSLPWWFREMRLDGSWKPGSTRSRRPWAEVWSTLS